MKIYFGVSCLGYSVKGYGNLFELEISDEEVDGMTEEEKKEYIEESIYEYILDNLDYGYEIEE